GLAYLLHHDEDDRRRPAARHRLDGRAGHRGGEVAQADPAGRQPDGARQRHKRARLAEQAGPRLRHVSLGGVQRSRREGDDARLPADGAAPPSRSRRMRYFDDIAVGDRIALGTHTFTAEDIKAFARQYDPQPFHMDEAVAAQSHFGALCASGWHTIAAWMNLRVQYGKREDAERAARGEIIAKLGPSPGFRELKCLKPVYAGDTLTYASEVVEKRVTKSRPGWGIIFAKNTGTNQNGELVMSFIGSGFVERRPGAA